MSVYSVKGKGWRYDFILKGVRYTEAWFKTKKEATKAEAGRKEEIQNPSKSERTQIDMAFLDLVNKRLDYLRAYNSNRYYTDHVYMAKRWVKAWGHLNCREISLEMVQSYVLDVSEQISANSSNAVLRCLRALFNFGKHPSRRWIACNPTDGIEFLPLEKKLRYVPAKHDVLKVIMSADAEAQDYLWTIALTMGRMSEINRLTWNDVDLEDKYVVLYTRKKKGGHLTPRKVPMPDKLHGILSRRSASRDKTKPWVFWHKYWDRKKSDWTEGPYRDRKGLMKNLCKKANVEYFRFHALRHFGASMLDRANVSIGSIQRILGHENRTTTEIYLHSIDEIDRAAMDILGAQIEKNPHTDSHTKINHGLR
jgi:integrase